MPYFNRKQIRLNLRMNSEDFDPERNLSANIIIELAGNRLYTIGLSLFQMGSTLRPIYNNPLFVFLLLSAVLIVHILALFKPD